MVDTFFQRISSWYHSYQEGMKHCRWNQITIEYSIKTNTSSSSSDAKLLKRGKLVPPSLLKPQKNSTDKESYFRVRKVVHVSKYVLKDVITSTTKPSFFATKKKKMMNMNISNNMNDDDNQQEEEVGIIRILILPGKPKSGLPRDEIILTIIKQQKQIMATYVAIIVFTILYFYLSIKILSLIGGQHTTKRMGWKLFILNFIELVVF